MKAQLLLTTLIFLVATISVFSQATYKHHQTFSSHDAAKVKINVDVENIEVKPIKGSRIVVETMIKISSSNSRLLEFIVEGGRYDIAKQYNTEKNELMIVSNKPTDVLVIKGEEIIEEVNYVIYIPETSILVSDELVVN